jgi:hypothetical protein
MKAIDSRKALLGGLLIITLVAGCAGGLGWSNNSGGYQNTYPNLDGSAGSHPYNNVYAGSTAHNGSYEGDHLDDNRAYTQAYAYSVEHRNPVSLELEPVPVYR